VTLEPAALSSVWEDERFGSDADGRRRKMAVNQGNSLRVQAVIKPSCVFGSRGRHAEITQAIPGRDAD
jgi:hypothetical protein